MNLGLNLGFDSILGFGSIQCGTWDVGFSFRKAESVGC